MNDMTTFNFELVSPEKILISEPAWQVTIPGEEGYFGVRAGHMSLVAALKPGVVEVLSKQGAAPEKIFIMGGFADVSAANCTILAEQAVNVDEIDKAQLALDIEKLAETLKNTGELADRSVIEKKLAAANLKLEAAQKSA